MKMENTGRQLERNWGFSEAVAMELSDSGRQHGYWIELEIFKTLAGGKWDESTVPRTKLRRRPGSTWPPAVSDSR